MATIETLRGVFPSVPTTALARVLEICEQSVEAASEWLLENDWEELVAEDRRRDEQNTTPAPTANGSNHVATLATQTAESAPLATTTTVSVSTETPSYPRGVESQGNASAPRGTSRGQERSPGHDDREFDSAGDQEFESDEREDEEDEDEEDEEDEDDEDDDGDGNSFYDSGDEAYYHGSASLLTKRVKVFEDEKTRDGSAEFFWACFDGQMVPKTLIELLNTTLTKLAHSKVTLLNISSKQIAEGDARDRLESILSRAEREAKLSTERTRWSGCGLSLSRILNGSAPGSPSPEPCALEVGQKRKRSEESTSLSKMGFFAHFFSINDLDMVWRSIMHAHLFNRRFGELIELHTASAGPFCRRDFDELMHIYGNLSSSSSRAGHYGTSPLSSLKCCLLLPCEASETEIFRVGKHLHSLLKLPGALYFRTLDPDATTTSGLSDGTADLLNEEGKLTEESFRRFARFRVKKEEIDAPGAGDKKPDSGPDHFLAYQRQQKVDFCLQAISSDGWKRCASD